jgi:hypothetical protein
VFAVEHLHLGGSREALIERLRLRRAVGRSGRSAERRAGAGLRVLAGHAGGEIDESAKL